MFQANVFSANVFAPRVFIGRGAEEATAVFATTWRFGGAPFVNQALSYVIKDQNDQVILTGDGATDGTGKLEIDVPIMYSGMSLMIHVENVGSDMVTTGKVHGTQVALVA